MTSEQIAETANEHVAALLELQSKCPHDRWTCFRRDKDFYSNLAVVHAKCSACGLPCRFMAHFLGGPFVEGAKWTRVLKKIEAGEPVHVKTTKHMRGSIPYHADFGSIECS